MLDANGYPTVRCLAPKRIVTKKRSNGQTYKVVEDVKFENEKGQIIDDQHIHTFTYQGSEEISVDKKKQQQMVDKKELQAMMGDALDNAKIIDHTPKPLTPEDGITLKE